MTMRIATEALTDLTAAEVEALVRDYFARTQAHEDTPALDFDWPTFQAIEERGGLLLVTARDRTPAATLLGFALYTACRHPHHDMLVASCDMVGVAPEARGQGVASKLIKHAEIRMKSAGISRIIHNHRHTYHGVDPLFPKLGFRAAETVFVKDI